MTTRFLAPWLVLAFLAACGGSGGPAPDATADPGIVLPDGTAPDPGPADAGGDARPDGGGTADAPDTGTDAPAGDLPPADPAPGDAPDDPGPGTDPGAETAADPGADTGSDPGADAGEEPAWNGLFDPDRIRDPDTAACTFSNPRSALKDGVLLDVWDVSYRSWESIGGTLRPITIRGFAARPKGGGQTLPGVVQAHGLGGYAEESHATGTAALLGTFVLAYTGPGGGTDATNTSEGIPASHDDGYRMFDTLADPRGSWFWGHAVAGLRGLTCLADRPDVDPTRMGMTGFSAGGVVTLIGAAVDDRIRAAVPLSACGAWDVAVQAPGAWQRNLLTLAGLTVASPEWTTLIDTIDSSRLLPATTARILMVNGSADEFFPLTAHDTTFAAIPGDAKRTAIAGNFDHGCYTVLAPENKDVIEARAEVAAKGGQRMWFANAFGTDADFAYVPLAPQNLTFTQVGNVWIAHVVVDGGGANLSVDAVRLWASTDAKVWASLELESKGSGIWGTRNDAFVPQDPATLVHYVDVTYRTNALINPHRFSISTRPTFPAGHVPAIRDMQSCL